MNHTILIGKDTQLKLESWNGIIKKVIPARHEERLCHLEVHQLINKLIKRYGKINISVTSTQ